MLGRPSRDSAGPAVLVASRLSPTGRGQAPGPGGSRPLFSCFAGPPVKAPPAPLADSGVVAVAVRG
eukprot:3936543-Lingulodinium_polyedra.AAC.1